MHLTAYLAGAGSLIVANFILGGYWWALWVAAAWGAALAVHYLIYRSNVANEGWAEERAADLRSKSYDASHIDSIAERYNAEKPAPPDERN